MAECCITSSLTQEEQSSDNFELSPSGSLPTTDYSEMGDCNEYTCIEQEVYILDLMQEDFPVTLHTQCVLCHAIFATRQLSIEHFETAHGGKLFECRFCRLTFVMEDNLQQHYEKHGLKLAKLKNNSEKKSKEGAPLRNGKPEAHQQEKMLENDTEGDTVVSNQNGTHFERNMFNNNSINEQDLNVSITNGKPNTFEENLQDIHKYDTKENVVPDEPVSERVSSAKRELKFDTCVNKDEQDKEAKEATPTSTMKTGHQHRNLYVQRHNKCLKKLRDVIQKRSAAKKKNLKQEKTDKNKSTIQDEHSKMSQTRKVINCSGIEIIDREVRTIMHGTETDTFMEESASNGDKFVTVIASPESITSDKSVAIKCSEDLDLYQDTAQENVLEETTNVDVSIETTNVDVSIETTKMDVTKDTTNVDVSKDITNTDVSKETTNVDVSNETTNMDVSKETTNVDVSAETTKMDVIKDTTNIDVSKETTNLDELKGSTNMDVSKEIINMDESAETRNMDVSEEITNEPPNDNEPVDSGKEVTDTRAENAKDDRLWCTRCNISLKNKYTLRKHFKSLIHKFNKNADHPLEREVCYECASGFANKRNLWKHKTFKCYFRNKGLNASTSDQSRFKDNDKNKSLVQAAGLMDHSPCKKKKEQGITRVHHTGNPNGNSNPHDVASEEEAADIPSHGTQKNKSTNSDMAKEDQEQTSSQKDAISREQVPRNGEYERPSNTAFGRETRVNDSTINENLDRSAAISRKADQPKTPDIKQKSNPTKCNGCGVMFSSRKRCKRHAKNRCAAFKEIQPIPLTISPEQDADSLVDPRKMSKPTLDAVIESATVKEMPKLHIACKDCGKQFSKRSKYLKHARKHGDLPKLKPQTSKTVSIETNPANEFTKLVSSLTNPDVDITVRVPDFPTRIFQCLKCYRCFESEIAMQFHMEKFCSGPKIHGSATSSSTTSTTSVPRDVANGPKIHGSATSSSTTSSTSLPREVDKLGCGPDITVKCCICLESFSTRTGCYRHLSMVHRLSRRKAIELERGYLQQQIRMNFDFMVNRADVNKRQDVIPAVNLGLSWKLETIEFPDVRRTTTSHPHDLSSN